MHANCYIAYMVNACKHTGKIGEDCRENDQCTGDAMCLNSRCNCLDGYRIIAGGTKCAPPSGK